jgi:hypothetical protein
LINIIEECILWPEAEAAGVDVSQLRLDGESLLPYVLKANSKKSNGSTRTFFHHCNSEIFAVRLSVSMKLLFTDHYLFYLLFLFLKIFGCQSGSPFHQHDS